MQVSQPKHSMSSGYTSYTDFKSVTKQPRFLEAATICQWGSLERLIREHIAAPVHKTCAHIQD